MPSRLRPLVPVAVVLVVLAAGWLVAAQPWETDDTAPGPVPAATEPPAGTPGSLLTPTADPALPAGYDLERDEARGGHTIERHVGKTEPELRERLRREPDISAASSFYDLEIARRVVTAAMASNLRQIEDWSEGSGPRSNLVLRYRHSEPVGMMLRRGASSAREVRSVTVVLRWAGDGWYVLTSYPNE